MLSATQMVSRIDSVGEIVSSIGVSHILSVHPKGETDCDLDLLAKPLPLFKYRRSEQRCSKLRFKVGLYCTLSTWIPQNRSSSHQIIHINMNKAFNPPVVSRHVLWHPSQHRTRSVICEVSLLRQLQTLQSDGCRAICNDYGPADISGTWVESTNSRKVLDRTHVDRGLVYRGYFVWA